jgi:tetratricopeptide (TPR) repeat protein
MLRKLLLAAWFVFLSGLNCAPALGQSPAPPSPAITQQADKNREDARNAAHAAFEKGMRLYREQKAESLRAAILQFKAAARGHAEAGDQKDRGRVLVWIGLSYNDLGQKREGLRYYQQALSILREAGDRDGEATTLTNIGTIISQLGQNARR